jgi:hypothetical protein
MHRREEDQRMPLPQLLHTRPPAAEFVVAVAVPLAFGLITGVVLGVSEPAYLVLSVLGILGGYAPDASVAA